MNGDKMKKNLVPIVLSIIVGFLSAKFMFNQYDYKSNIKSVFNSGTKIYLIQAGVYSSLDTMKENMDKYGYYIYSFQNELYYSYVGIIKNSDNIDKIKGYYKELGYDIYIKEKNINDKDLVGIIEQYDNLLYKTNDNNIIKAILEQTLLVYEKMEGKNEN